MTTSDTLLHDVVARDQIRRLTAEYAHGLDARDLELFEGVWADDAQWQPSPTFDWCRGKEEILAMAEKIFSGVARTHHLVTNHIIDIDGETATGMSDMLSENLAPDGQWSRAVAKHQDRYVRQDGRWVIAHRSCDIELLG